MPSLHARLFGKFSLRYENHELLAHPGNKAQELMAYLLLNRDKMHSREWLASLLWNGECTTAQSRKYLRKALWRLQSSLQPACEELTTDLLYVDNDWIQLNTIPPLELDVLCFEQAFQSVEGMEGKTLHADKIREIEEVISRYDGGLLMNVFEDWCLAEKERFQWIYLSLLDKLAAYYQSHNVEKAIGFAKKMLLIDEIRECTHRRLMSLYAASGDRTSALRQYRECVRLLRNELDTVPSASTTALFHNLQSGGSTTEHMVALPKCVETASYAQHLSRIYEQAKSVVAQLEYLMTQHAGNNGSEDAKKNDNSVKKND